MTGRTTLTTATILFAVASLAAAEDPRSELSLNLGGTFTSVISGEVTPVGQTSVRIEAHPGSSLSLGLDYGYFVTERFQVGGLLSIQPSRMRLAGPNGWNPDGESLTVQNLMAVAGWHTGDAWTRTRFYVMGGLGVSRFGEVTVLGIDASTTISGRVRFATTLGAGVKHRASDRVGLKLDVRWSQSRLGELADEWTCSPYYDCQAAGSDSQAWNQIEIAGGLVLRF